MALKATFRHPNNTHSADTPRGPRERPGLEVQAEPRIVEAALGLLEEVSGKPRRALKPNHGPYAELVLAAKPIAYWRFEEMIIPQTVDSTPHRNHATYEDGIALYLPGPGSGDGISPTPQLAPSRFSGEHQINRAAHFAGGRVKAKLPNLGRTYSAEMWFWNGLENTVRPITGFLFSRGRDGDAAAAGDHLGIDGTPSSGRAGKLIFSTGNKLNQILVGRTLIERRTWHHVALVRDRAKVTVYLDGNLEPEISAEAASAPNQSSLEIFIGGRNDNVANFEGKLDEVAIYNRALSADEVAAHYKASDF